MALVIDVARDVPSEVHDGAGPPQDLLDGQLDTGRVLDEHAVLVGVLEQRVHPVRHRVPRRLVAGHREQQEEQVEVHLRQLVAVDLAVDQRAHDVVAGVLPSIVRELLGIHEHLDLRLHHALFGDGVFRVLATDHAIRPVEQPVTVFGRHTQELGDGLERELGGDLDHEVAFTAFVEDAVDDHAALLAHVILERSDHPRRESSIHQLPVPGVIRRIHREHEVARTTELLGALLAGLVELLDHHHTATRLVGRRRFPVAVEGRDVLVGRDHPEARAVRFVVMVDRCVLAQVREPLVRNAAGEDVAAQEVDFGQFHVQSSEVKPGSILAHRAGRRRNRVNKP